MNAASADVSSATLVDTAAPGRVCPLRYRYGPAAIAKAETCTVRTLYVIGGLYGNVPALDAIESMARSESAPDAPAPTLCFNGDFNWFNIADHAFAEVNRRVLQHDAILGNVEAELDTPLDDAGCGCAYPPSVMADVVERSNRIHARLKQTASHHAEVLARLARLPMFARYQVGECRIGVVHGDAESLAGWGFDVDALDDPDRSSWLAASFSTADVDLFASTHTCLPAMRRIARTAASDGWIANNGAAGMPNFAGNPTGLITRISTTPSPHPVLHELRTAGAYVALLPVPIDTERWCRDFLAQWPPGSPAWQSYFGRITNGPAFTPERAIASATRASVR